MSFPGVANTLQVDLFVWIRNKLFTVLPEANFEKIEKAKNRSIVAFFNDPFNENFKFSKILHSLSTPGVCNGIKIV